jgi:hypothetical protein
VRLTGLTCVEPLSESCPISPARTGLTGGAHRSDRCWSVDSRFAVSLRSRVGRVCVLVPRSSGTPVATWAWPTWVVSRRRVLEAVFILLEFLSRSRRIFIGSHSLPPSLVRHIGPSTVRQEDQAREAEVEGEVVSRRGAPRRIQEVHPLSKIIGGIDERTTR